MKTRIMNPILAEAIDHNAFRSSVGPLSTNLTPASPKISVNDDFLRKRQVQIEEISSVQQRTDLNRYYV